MLLGKEGDSNVLICLYLKKNNNKTESKKIISYFIGFSCNAVNIYTSCKCKKQSRSSIHFLFSTKFNG